MLNNEQNESAEDIEMTDEVTEIDELELADVEENSKSKIKSLQTKLKDCEAEKKQHLDGLQRAKADFLNTKKRLEEEKVRAGERAMNDHIERLLPLCDSFTMAMSNTEAWEAIDDSWRKGMEAIYTQLQGILKSYNVVKVDPTGEQFDPNRHEALGTEDSDLESETVSTVIQQGYERNGEIIRPAKVVLSK